MDIVVYCILKALCSIAFGMAFYYSSLSTFKLILCLIAGYMLMDAYADFKNYRNKKEGK